MADEYQFEGGFPTAETVRRAYDDADLSRAVEAYRFFFPTVSGLAIWKGNTVLDVTPNRVFGVLDTRPEHVGLTLNSDTPYGPMLLDLRDGPLVIELPPGPLICILMDLNQRWLADMGLPGPDAGKGGRFVVIPPNWTGDVPPDHHEVHATTFRVIGGVRVIPVGGDMDAAHDLVARVQVHPVAAAGTWSPSQWPDLTGKPQDTTPDAWETGLEFWRQLHEVVTSEPHHGDQRAFVGMLATLGIAADRPFEPDARMVGILERAARTANGQMRVEAFADRRTDRVVWPGEQWEWPSLRFEDGFFTHGDHVDLDAREKWFFQAIGASPAMFRRGAGAGSVYWLSTRDVDGNFLDGGKHYRLVVPQPVPAGLFWSVTLYDAESRSQVQGSQGKAALRSLFELAHHDDAATVELRFGPECPTEHEERWIETVPGRGWFVYFRVYGPSAAAFDGTWRLSDFEVVE